MGIFTFKKVAALSMGARGEQAAGRYLRRLGYKVLETNFCNARGRRLGEIDIIAQDGDEIVFVEVKTRTSFGSSQPLPEESITRAKLYKLNKAATYYLAHKKLQNTPYRFDAVTILADKGANSAKLRHFKNIFL